jgi:nicotinamide-nucleotide amidase
VATGGLGPTADDLTRDAIARATGRELVFDPDSLEHIRQLFARRKRPMPAQNEVQAMFPTGTRVIPNPHGTAPGISLTVERDGAGPCQIYSLPGVPAEMREMWDASVEPWLRQSGAGSRTVRHRKIRTFGAGESQVEAMLPDLIRRGRIPRVGITASRATISLRITAEGNSVEECDRAIEPTAALIYQHLGSMVFGEGDDELQHALVRILLKKQKTLATIEWGTAGLLAALLGEAPQAEQIYLGGTIITGPAALEQVGILDKVAGDLLTCSGPDMVEAMAVGCRRSFAADMALAVGPFPVFDPSAKEPKSFCFALADAQGVRCKESPFASHPDLLRILAAKQAMNLARLTLIDAALVRDSGQT